MAELRWSWFGASSIGTAHVRDGTECDDFGGCTAFDTQFGPSIIAAVSDGAGSASHSAIGARVAVVSFCRAARAFVRDGVSVEAITKLDAEDWVDDIRGRISHVAALMGEPQRAYAATLVGCIAHPQGAVILHIGDGACVLQKHCSEEWIVPSWPMQGEYASTTYFITDDPQPRLTLTHVDGPIEHVALFSDGLERLALDFKTKQAFDPFLKSMLAPLKDSTPGRRKDLSLQLRAFLDSNRVVSRTDDDKTFIAARLG